MLDHSENTFYTHNDSDPICANGTCLQGYVVASFDAICSIFGDPMDGNYKTDAEWNILFSDGEVATIYNWKDGRNYCGESGMEVEDIKDWHIGGNSKAVSHRIQNLLRNPWPILDSIR
jgi:hypothetical protein